MPRVSMWDGEGNDNVDYCADCAEEGFEVQKADTRNTGLEFEGPHDDHPCYSETDYRCDLCKKRLTERDN